MSFTSSSGDQCRICLNNDVFFDWTEAIFEFSGPSYKECYYQFTHIQEQEEEDIFTQMLCHDCADGLRNSYHLVEKALKSYEILKEKTSNTESLFLPDTHKLLDTDLEKQKLEKSLSNASISSTLFEEIIVDESSQNYQEFDSNYEFEINIETDDQQKKTPFLCSYCSRLLNNKYALQLHEETHLENRERKETCEVCGLKFYDKGSLRVHKRIHKENREKNHKCEFCTKAFYDMGALNIHRRIHLGQMIPCSLCPKQYYRQCDLDLHMRSHSATSINSEAKKKTRYFVRCKYCDKSIVSTNFNTHTSIHLNEPLMKCSLCDREFFSRKGCVRHLKKVHQKTKDNFSDFIIKYKKSKISHLYLEQKADMQMTDE